METVNCDLCHKLFKNKNSLRAHKHYAHKDDPNQTTLDLHIHPQDKEDKDLANYLEIKGNVYDEKDFKDFKGKQINQKPRNKHKFKPYTRSDKPNVGPSSGIDKDVFSCHICKNLFESQEDRGDHIDSSHPICKLCQDRFPNFRALKKHMTTFHPPTVKCSICDKSFTDINKLIQHIEIHPQCTICNTRFGSLSKLEIHIKTHASSLNDFNENRLIPRKPDQPLNNLPGSDVKKIQPESDSQETLDYDRQLVPLHDHDQDLDSYNEGEAHVESIDEDASERELKDESSPPQTSKRNKCSICHKKFLTSKDLHRHLKVHFQKKKRKMDRPKSYDNRSIWESESTPESEVKKTQSESDSQETLDYDRKLVPLHDHDQDLDSYTEGEADVESIDEDASEQELKDTSSPPQTSKRNKCNICHKKFLTSKDLQQHLKVHYQKKKRRMDRSKSYDNRSIWESESTPESEVKKMQSESDSQETLDYDRKLVPLHDHDPDIDSFTEEEAEIESIDEDASETEKEDGRSFLQTSKMKKCSLCHKKFLTTKDLQHHLKVHYQKKKRRIDGKYSSNHCQICQREYENQPALLLHISIEHPTCTICKQSFVTKEQFLMHNRDVHPEKGFVPEESESSLDSGDELDNIDVDFKRHINCVSIEKFLEIRRLISRNEFTALSSDVNLLHSLSVIMRGVKRGFIPICSTQRLVLTNDMKGLLYQLAKRPSRELVLKKKQTLTHLFDILWKSVKLVSDAFTQYQ